MNFEIVNLSQYDLATWSMGLWVPTPISLWNSTINSVIWLKCVCYHIKLHLSETQTTKITPKPSGSCWKRKEAFEFSLWNKWSVWQCWCVVWWGASCPRTGRSGQYKLLFGRTQEAGVTPSNNYWDLLGLMLLNCGVSKGQSS